MAFSLHKNISAHLGLQILLLLCVYLSAASVSITHAELYITDDYLQGLDAEADSEPLQDKNTNTATNSQATSAADILKALESRFNFETLLRTKHPTSYAIYNKLSTSDRILIYEDFKDTKELALAKRMIIKRFDSK